MNGISVTAMIVLASFVIERLTAGLLFLFSSSRRWRQKFEDPLSSKDKSERAQAERRRKWLQFALAGSLGLIVVLSYPKIVLWHVLDNTFLNGALTWLVLVAGSDRIGELLKGGNGSGEERAEPIEIRGRVTLVEEGENKPTVAGR